MLPDPSGGQIPAHDRLEQMTDDMMPDDQSMCKDLEREQFARRAGQPQWCLVGLNKSQKRRVQRLRQSEILEEEQKQTLNWRGVRSQVWRVKPRADDRQDPGSSAPREFMAPAM